MRRPRRPAPPPYRGEPSPPPARPTGGETAGIGVIVGVIAITMVVIFARGPVLGVAVGLGLTIAAIVAVTLLDR